MAEMKWVDKHIEVTPPKRFKKCTGTRFATVLGLNVWATPFSAWCAITKTYEEPFVENQYVIAGKEIEPLQIAYMRKAYLMDNLRTPTDIYGADYFNKTWGDFFKDNPHCGGMFDSILVDDDDKPTAVLEFKTTKRSEDWENDVPEYYALQAALYAYLLGVDDVIMVASFLEAKDYENPKKFKPSVKNTITVDFKLSERYPDFAGLVEKVEDWWRTYVDTGISPDYDEKKDAEILKALRTHNLTPNTDIEELVEEAEALKIEVDVVTATIADKEKRLKELTDLIKEHALKQFRDGDKKVDIKGNKFTYSVSLSVGSAIDKDALKAAGLLEKYSTPTTTYRMTVKEEK